MWNYLYRGCLIRSGDVIGIQWGYHVIHIMRYHKATNNYRGMVVLQQKNMVVLSFGTCYIYIYLQANMMAQDGPRTGPQKKINDIFC